MQSRLSIFNQQALVPQIAVKHRIPDRLRYLKDKAHYFSHTLSQLAKSLSITFSLDKLSVHHLQKNIATFMLAGGGFMLGEVIAKTAAQYCANDEEYDFVAKFLLGAAITAYSATHCLTEEKVKEGLNFSLASASEVMAVTYLYAGSFEGMQKVLQSYMLENVALLSSLAASALVIPASLAKIAETLQFKRLTQHY